MSYQILTPSEFQNMKDVPLPACFKIPRQQRNMWLDVMMFTGMRYKELLYLDGHWEQFDSKNNAISLPAEILKQNRIMSAKGKPRFQARDRTIHLTPAFSKSLSQYLREFKTLELPGRDVMNANLKRWWLSFENPEPHTNEMHTYLKEHCSWSPTVKTFRKSWESWLLMADYPIHKVAMSQGHTVAISEHHYANLSPKLKSEIEQARALTAGWGT